MAMEWQIAKCSSAEVETLSRLLREEFEPFAVSSPYAGEPTVWLKKLEWVERGANATEVKHAPSE